MSLARTLLWPTAFFLLVAFVVTLLTGIAPLWQFGIAAVICVSLLPLFVWLDKRVLGPHTDKTTTDLDTLLAYLKMRDHHWQMVTESWVGRQVRITEEIQDAKDLLGKTVILHKGMVGEIIGLNEEPVPPFRVRFAEH